MKTPPHLLAALALALSFLAFQLGVAAADGAEAPDPGDKMKEKWDSLPEDKKAAGMNKAETKNLFGKFSYNSQGYVDGRFVHFHLVASTGVIHDYAVANGSGTVEFFDEITPEGFQPKKAAFLTGSVLHVPSDFVGIMAHNNPTGIISWHSKQDDMGLRFQLAPNVTIPNTDAAKEIRLNLGTAHGHLLTNGASNILVSSNTLLVTLDASEKVMFRYHALVDNVSADLHDQNAAFKAGKMGSVVNIVDAGGVPLEDQEHGDVFVETTEITKGKVTIKADGHQTGPRVLFLSIDGGTLDPARADQITVKLNGATVTRAANMTALLASTGDAVVVITMPGAVKVNVHVSHFSEQTLELEQGEATDGDGKPTNGVDSSTGVPAPGFFLAIVAALGGLVALRRRSGRTR